MKRLILILVLEDKSFLKKNIKTHLNNINNYGLKNSIININNSKL